MDTPGAYPGLGAEERGQAEAIARNLREMARLQVPDHHHHHRRRRQRRRTGHRHSRPRPDDGELDLLGHLARRLRLHHVARRHQERAGRPGPAHHAQRLEELGCIDGIVPEPEGGAHADHEAAAALLMTHCRKHLSELKKAPSELVDARYDKFRNMAQFFTGDE